MFKGVLMGAVVTAGLCGMAHAAIVPVHGVSTESAIVTVGEGCGAGSWRGPDSRCRPFHTPYGSNRNTRFECPPGWHIGSGGARCWRN